MIEITDEALANWYLPDAPDWGEPPYEIAELLTVPVIRHPAKLWLGNPDDKPFEIVATQWAFGWDSGPLTKETFQLSLKAAIKEFAGYFNSTGEFNAYPINYKPHIEHGRAFHDWTGVKYPFDVRAVIIFSNDIHGDGQAIPGYKFFLTTMVAKQCSNST